MPRNKKRPNGRNKSARLQIGDSVQVTAKNRLFSAVMNKKGQITSGHVGEITEIERVPLGTVTYIDGRESAMQYEMRYHVGFINSGVYFGTGIYERWQLRRCAPLIPLTG